MVKLCHDSLENYVSTTAVNPNDIKGLFKLCFRHLVCLTRLCHDNQPFCKVTDGTLTPQKHNGAALPIVSLSKQQSNIATL